MQLFHPHHWKAHQKMTLTVLSDNLTQIIVSVLYGLFPIIGSLFYLVVILLLTFNFIPLVYDFRDN